MREGLARIRHCLYCGEPDKALCDDCYEEKQRDFLDMRCPNCGSGNIEFLQKLNSWCCYNCDWAWVWKW